MSLDNEKIVMAAWQKFGSRDPEAIGTCFARDAEWIAPEGNATAIALGMTNHMVGRDAIAHFLSVEFPRLFVADVMVDFRSWLAGPEHVVVEERMQATLANGRRYDNDYCFVFMVRDGLITQVREYMDTSKGIRQIFGDLPPGPLQL